MICDTLPEQVEWHDKMQDIIHPEYNPPKESKHFLSMKMNEFCEKTGINPAEMFERSNKPECVMKKVAFVHYLPKGYSPTKIANFLGWTHSTVYNWRNNHEVFMEQYDYRQIISKL